MPSEVLGPRGTLLLNNPSLRSLSLTTDPSCHGASVSDCEIDLSPLRQLQSLRWRGPEAHHFETLCHAIENNAERLQSLELDFIAWHRFRDSLKLEEPICYNAEEWCANKIFGLTKQPSQPVFPAIRKLSLTEVPLAKGMGQRIGLETLVSLKLSKCWYWPLFLEEIIQRGDPIRLKALEIRDSIAVTWRGAPESMSTFLTAFEGLEELFLCYWNSSKRDYVERWNILSSGIWNGAAHHRATLRRLGYNRRETVWVAPEGDVLDEGLYSWAINETEDRPSQHPLADLDLDFIGLSCAPRLLVRTYTKPHLKSAVCQLITGVVGINPASVCLQDFVESSPHPSIWQRLVSRFERGRRDGGIGYKAAGRKRRPSRHSGLV